MLEYFRTITKERDAAVDLCSAQTAESAAGIVAKAALPRVQGFGAAVLLDGRILAATGEMAAEAASAASADSEGPRRGRKEGEPACVSVEVADRGRKRGRLALAAADPSRLDAGIACSLERLAGSLGDALGRIDEFGRLDAALRDRELLLREQRHRFANSIRILPALVAMAIPAEGELDARALADIQARAEAIAALHGLLELGDPSRPVRATIYFGALADLLREAFEADGGFLASLVETEAGASMPTERAVAVGLAIHELVMNSLKHSGGKPVRADLRVVSSEGGLSVRYRDEGARPAAERGGAAAEPPSGYGAGSGSGLLLIRDLTARARGRRVDDGTDPGFFEAVFPVGP